MKKRAALLHSIIAVTLIAGCALRHGHQPAESAYSETNRGNESYSIRYHGSKHTSPEKAADLCLLRCAQLAKEENYGYFEVEPTQEDSIINSADKSQVSRTVKFLKDKTEGANVYETSTVLDDMASKYHITNKDPGGSVHSTPWE